MILYTLADLIFSMLFLALFALGAVGHNLAFAILGFIGYFIYPIGMEILMAVYTSFAFKDIKYIAELAKKRLKMKKLQYPIVYDPRYDIKAFGLEKLHFFDGQKYGKIYDRLIREKIIIDDSNMHKPKMISRGLLLLVISFKTIIKSSCFGLQAHSRMYLLRLCYSITMTKILELPVFMIPAPLIRWKVLEPLMLQTQGTIDAALLALEKGWAINIGGGFHHAYYNDGSRFSFYADISLCIIHLKRYVLAEKHQKFLVIDLDAHQGNGHERDFVDDPDVLILDSYNPDVYPYDFPARKSIMIDMPIDYNDTNDTYIDRLFDQLYDLKKNFDKFKPDFIVYNAGTDVLKGDPLGMLNLTKEGIIQRDEMVFNFALSHNIPILMLLSGGYHADSVDVIVNSIKNIVSKFNLLQTLLNFFLKWLIIVSLVQNSIYSRYLRFKKKAIRYFWPKSILTFCKSSQLHLYYFFHNSFQMYWFTNCMSVSSWSAQVQ